MPDRFVLNQDYDGNSKGTVVYSASYSDYGCASDDSRNTGVEHKSVTYREDGNYPFFTVPTHVLEKQ